jgi:hypothetical protein
MAHWDGSSWTNTRLRTEAEIYTAIWGTGPNDVFAAGFGVVHHYDGTQWTSSSVSNFVVLDAIHGTGADDVFAISDRSIEYYDTAWQPILHYEETGARFRAVWVTESAVFIAGDNGTLLRLLRTTW